MRRSWWVIAGLLLLALWAWSQRAPQAVSDRAPAAQSARDAASRKTSPPPLTAPSARDAERAYPAFLPAEAVDTLRRIASDGPFEHRQDGATFQNRERRLPSRPRGYYREYTVETPGSRDRGARRIIAGGDPPSEYFYTDDHYRSFRRFTLDDTGAVR